MDRVFQIIRVEIPKKNMTLSAECLKSIAPRGLFFSLCSLDT
ncbi:hypothetical protein HBZS_112000 [Helicobacter bizzozeronii CCUG 35545]|nr:hypothetical protein HBZS_112000 [Helicobacter bizzozeronii CCUG 35545]